MTNLKIIYTLTLFLSVSLTAVSQTVKTLDSLANQYQTCLDKGQYMLGYSKEYYSQIDSMLNVAYFKLRLTLNQFGKEKLKMEQKGWLSKRDAFFQRELKVFKVKNPNTSFEFAQDDAMFMYNDNAEFVKTRVLILLKRLSR